MLTSCCEFASAKSFGLCGLAKIPAVDRSTNSIVFDRSKCVMCQGCVKVCRTISGIKALKAGTDASGKEAIVPSTGVVIADTKCIKCGQCSLQCPVGAITEKDQTSDVLKVLKAPQGRLCVAQTAPAVRVALSDALGLPAGTISTGKMVTALKKLGFQYVFDTNWSADLTIVEESSELIHRLTTPGEHIPMFTSCCPAWINFVEQSRPDLIPNISSCRSPMSMLSSVIKGEFAQNKGVNPKNVFNVAIMPCTAKKDEIERQGFNAHGYKETDFVLTVRELSRMIKKAKIDFKTLPDTAFDVCYGQSSGAGVIFAATGGVMEAALRTAYEYITGKKMEPIDLTAVRGMEGIKVASVDINGKPVKVAVVHGINNAQKLLKKIKDKEAEVEGLAFVEVMACPGGCVCGGGTTKPKTKKAIEKRIQALYTIDSSCTIRRSHENPEIKQFYERCIGKPNSEKAHELLHTHYHKRN